MLSPHAKPDPLFARDSDWLPAFEDRGRLARLIDQAWGLAYPKREPVEWDGRINPGIDVPTTVPRHFVGESELDEPPAKPALDLDWLDALREEHHGALATWQAAVGTQRQVAAEYAAEDQAHADALVEIAHGRATSASLPDLTPEVRRTVVIDTFGEAEIVARSALGDFAVRALHEASRHTDLLRTIASCALPGLDVRESDRRLFVAPAKAWLGHVDGPGSLGQSKRNIQQWAQRQRSASDLVEAAA